MRQLLYLILLLFFSNVYAQVPPPIRGDIDDSMVIPESVMPKAGSSKKSSASYKINGKYGFISPDNIKQEAIYEQIIPNEHGFMVKKDGLYGIADKNGVLIIKIEFDAIDYSIYKSGNAYIVRKKDSYGSISTSGKSILSTKYPKILYSDPGNLQSFVLAKDGQAQMITNAGEKTYAQKIEFVSLYANLAILKVNGKFGVVKGGEQIVPFQYDSIYHETKDNNLPSNQVGSNNLRLNPLTYKTSISQFIVKQNGKFGLVDSTGKIIYAPDYNLISTEKNAYSPASHYIIQKDQLKGMYFPSTGKKTDLIYDDIYRDGSELILAKKGKNRSAFNPQGAQLFPEEYETILAFGDKYFEVAKEGKRGLVDQKGKIIVSLLYSSFQRFDESSLKDYLEVRSDNKSGVVNYKNQVIIPVAFDYISAEKNFFRVTTKEPNPKVGLYDTNGKVIIAAEYDWIGSSATEGSKILIAKKGATYHFLDANMKLIVPEALTSYGHIPNDEQLLNPESPTGNYLLYVKNKAGKVGAINEMTGKLAIPMIYDAIIQRFEGPGRTNYSVRIGKKYGLVNNRNEIIIPIQYDGISLNLVKSGIDQANGGGYNIVVSKNGKMGTVNLKNQPLIPFVYSDLKRISGLELYKAKSGKHYQLLNKKNQVLNPGPFDEISNFEMTGPEGRESALSFYNGQMRLIDQNGKFIGKPKPMKPHQGYHTFEELKLALIKALDSPDEGGLKRFADQIAPSEHILHFLNYNHFSREPMGADSGSIELIKEKYYQDLLEFKQDQWQRPNAYNHLILTAVTDYTALQEGGYVGNMRSEEHDFGDRLMSRFLRNAMKINGYWISTYFMTRDFEHD
ncbi:WG repeat-containing protein [Pedobacter gandavensis]|uniref:WG repeat-containing protein n=1 Tax=Pedobacter gandavensis TaxID=2679963 RepID=UPI00292FC17D|nr:WG repeat-containing protein [Pedobacter gandavensis]